ncbi:MAG TPA: YceI family protein, partial [Candidatus Dormibacteraeota bacterium]|nr:YceI family protein [Candidatus Dormibacteraeota bacterium]
GTRVFTIDTSRSTVSYTVTEHVPTISQFHPAIGTFRVTGRAPVRGGTIHVAPSPGASSVRDVTVDALQLKTDQGLRDQFIDPGLADALAPFAEFSSTSLSGLPATIADGATIQFKLTGRMQIHDVVQPVTLDTTATISGGTLSASATATFDMNVFRVSPPSGGVSTVDPTVTLEVHLVATAGP